MVKTEKKAKSVKIMSRIKFPHSYINILYYTLFQSNYQPDLRISVRVFASRTFLMRDFTLDDTSVNVVLPL